MKKARLAFILATSSDISASYFKPLGLGYIKSYLNLKIPEIEVRIYEDIDQLILEKPDCIGISASTENFSLAQKYVEKIKQNLNCPIIIGGVHISLLPDSLPPGTIGCIGEGEETVLELMEVFLRENQFSEDRLRKINGIAYRDSDKKLIITPTRELIRPLDTLPFPDRNSLGIMGNVENLYIFTSRGCPYECKFCVSRVHWNKYREFSSAYVINEMEHLIRNFHVKKITIFDDLFIVNRKRLREIVEEFCARKFNVDICCAVRANLVDDELCQLLKKMNVSVVTFGAESFSEPVLKELKCSSVTVEQNKNAIELFNKYGIQVNCSLIFNSPEQTLDDMIVTWKTIFHYLKDKKINKVGLGVLRPYPGSYYWTMALKRGIVSCDMDWELFKHPEGLSLNENVTLESWHLLFNEWNTKCALIDPTYFDGGEEFSSRYQIFFKNERIIKSILDREIKDDTDYFVQNEYEKFLGSLTKHKISFLGGWIPPVVKGNCWIRKTATFSISSSICTEGDYFNLVFFIPDISLYPDRRITVELDVGNIKSEIEVNENGFHKVTIPLPVLSKFFSKSNQKQYLEGKIKCSAEISPSPDDRFSSIQITKFEIAQKNPENVVNFIPIDTGQFSGSSMNHEILLLGGWTPPGISENYWIRKTATFFISSSIFEEGDYINLVFFIPDISHYPEHGMTVELDIANIKRRIEVNSSGFHKLTIPLPFISKIFSRLIQKQFVEGKIQCSTEFIPSQVSDSSDDRISSILVTRFEIARKNPDNVVNLVPMKYKEFSGSSLKHAISLLEGFTPPGINGECWIQKTAKFSLSSSVFKEGDYINLVFFIPDISHYPEHVMTVELDIANIKRRIEVNSNGFHKLTIPLSFMSKIFSRLVQKQFVEGKILCSAEFNPSHVSDSPDDRNISILVINFEIARKIPDNVINVIKLSD